MKYIDVQSVARAYKNFQDSMTNKSWGVLCIMKQLSGSIVPGSTYAINCAKLSTFIENLFCLSDSKKEYNDNGKNWYVKFSTNWDSFFFKQKQKKPNIYDIITWVYRNEPLPDNIDDEYLIQKFSKEFNINDIVVKNIFECRERNINYISTKYKERELLSAISKLVGTTLDKNITAECKSIAASPGELSRGPFIQTLYAALDTTDYVLISQTDFDTLYPMGKDLSQNQSNPSSPTPHQQIFYGAPGTGKSHTIKRVVEDGNLPHIRTTFHPDSDYSTFVGAYKPTTIDVPMRDVSGHIIVEGGNQVIEKKIIYTFVPQAFLKAYVAAWSNLNEPFFLIIEEINRGNCAQIFGDLFQLLDRNSEGISDYPITSDDDIRRYLNSKFSALDDTQRANIPDEILSGEKMLLPRNLHIWATMNTSDQSLFPIDSAFKRRWDWKYTPIANGNKGWKITADGKEYDWWQFLEKINAQIGNATHSEDKKLGYYFCKPINNQTIDAETFVSKVVFYLWNDVFKDFAEDAGSIFNDEDGSVLSFNKFYTTDTNGNAVVVEQKITQFLQNLGVEPLQDVE